MYATKFFERIILNTLRGQSATAPATVYVGLYLTNPGETGQGGIEASYTGYQRQPIIFSEPGPINQDGQAVRYGIQNTTDITFPLSPSSIGNVTHIGISDSLSAGNMMMYSAFTEPISIVAQEAPTILVGRGQFWFTGSMTDEYKKRAFNYARGTNMLGVTPYWALFNGHPESGGAELVGDNYARIAVTFTSPTDTDNGNSMIQNADDIATQPATTTWGTLRYNVLMDAQSGGFPIMAQQRDDYIVAIDKMVQINAGQLVLTIN